MEISTMRECNQSEIITMKEIEIAESIVTVLRITSGFRDIGTRNHNRRLNKMARRFVKHIGLTDSHGELYGLGAELSDIGKIGVPDNILLKAGSLTIEEREVIETHTNMGFEILTKTSIKILKYMAKYALYHHEQWCGKGYPMGLKGSEIPFGARVVSIVDVTDALLSKRPYKEEWERKDVYEFIMNNKGVMFDPWMVDIFIENFDDIVDVRDSATLETEIRYDFITHEPIVAYYNGTNGEITIN
jgi:response regulator RpfG family c-di-GMP phosphodiesterase